MADKVELGGDIPVRLLLGGLIVGSIVAAIAPVSDYERRIAVPARSELTHRARRALDEFLDRAKSALAETFAAAGESAS